MLVSVIPYLDIHAANQICSVSLLHSAILCPSLSPVNDDRNPVHWAFMFKILGISEIKNFLCIITWS